MEKKQNLRNIQLNLPILPPETSEKVVGAKDEIVRLLAEMLLLAADAIQERGDDNEAK